MFDAWMNTGMIPAAKLEAMLEEMSLARKEAMANKLNTLNGLMQTYKKAVESVQQSVGNWLVKELGIGKALHDLIDLMMRLKHRIDALEPTQRKFLIGLAAVLAALPLLIVGLGAVVTAVAAVVGAIAVLELVAIPGLMGAMLAFIGTIAPWALAIAAVGAAFYVLYDDFIHWTKDQGSILGDLLGPWNKYKDVLTEVYGIAKAIFTLFTNPLMYPGAAIDYLKNSKGVAGLAATIGSVGRSMNADSQYLLSHPMAWSVPDSSKNGINVTVNVQGVHGELHPDTKNYLQNFAKDVAVTAIRDSVTQASRGFEGRK
jgi:hypothetical protein